MDAEDLIMNLLELITGRHVVASAGCTSPTSEEGAIFNVAVIPRFGFVVAYVAVLAYGSKGVSAGGGGTAGDDFESLKLPVKIKKPRNTPWLFLFLGLVVLIEFSTN